MDGGKPQIQHVLFSIDRGCDRAAGVGLALGVVPLAAEDRAFREAVGRALCVIAQRAESVTRCVCGIGVRIK